MPAEADPFERRAAAEVAAEPNPFVHIIREGIRCETDKRGQATPGGGSLFEIVVDASEGFIPLWAKGSVLRWRFRPGTLRQFQNPNAAAAAIQRLMGEAILAWGPAAPVRFAKRSTGWDFEIVVREQDDCDASGCVLASAFFPDGGQHQLVIYPMMFRQDRAEQVETMVHEIGHIFGLRHFFALLQEQAWKAEVFGAHVKFSIMNYGADSKLTQADIDDLKMLYELAWSGKLRSINGTDIKFVKPYHETPVTDSALAIAAVRG